MKLETDIDMFVRGWGVNKSHVGGSDSSFLEIQVKIISKFAGE